MRLSIPITVDLDAVKTLGDLEAVGQRVSRHVMATVFAELMKPAAPPPAAILVPPPAPPAEG